MCVSSNLALVHDSCGPDLDGHSRRALILVGALYHRAPWGPDMERPFHLAGMFRFNIRLACRKCEAGCCHPGARLGIPSIWPHQRGQRRMQVGSCHCYDPHGRLHRSIERFRVVVAKLVAIDGSPYIEASRAADTVPE